MNLPTDIFGVVFYVVRKISNLIFGDALQPINNQLQTAVTKHTCVISEFNKLKIQDLDFVISKGVTWLCRMVASRWKSCSTTTFSLSLGTCSHNRQL